MKSILEQNIAKVQELVPSARWAAEMFVTECYNFNIPIRITEAYRSQKRQAELFASGRTKPGPIKTWTLSSNHTKRLAIDLYHSGGKNTEAFYREVDSVANKYGIYRDPVLIKLGDLGHYSVESAKQPPIPRHPSSLSEAIRKLEREIRRTKPGRALERKKARYQELKRQQRCDC